MVHVDVLILLQCLAARLVAGLDVGINLVWLVLVAD